MPRNSAEILAKLKALDPPAVALADSTFLPCSRPDLAQAEVVVTDRGRFISSPEDGWVLHPMEGE